MKSGKALLIAVLVFAVYLVHQDYWNWKKTEPLIFGFLPIGLAYHAGYSILAAILMAVLVRIAWPKHLEETQSDEPGRPGEKTERH
jgi:uncharacterized oligopeptide transporter (OPT) family protein